MGNQKSWKMAQNVSSNSPGDLKSIPNLFENYSSMTNKLKKMKTEMETEIDLIESNNTERLSSFYFQKPLMMRFSAIFWMLSKIKFLNLSSYCS